MHIFIHAILCQKRLSSTAGIFVLIINQNLTDIQYTFLIYSQIDLQNKSSPSILNNKGTLLAAARPLAIFTKPKP